MKKILSVLCAVVLLATIAHADTFFSPSSGFVSIRLKVPLDSAGNNRPVVPDSCHVVTFASPDTVGQLIYSAATTTLANFGTSCHVQRDTLDGAVYWNLKDSVGRLNAGSTQRQISGSVILWWKGAPFQTDFNIYVTANTVAKLFSLPDSIDAKISSRLAPTTAGRTIDVAATGEAGLDFDNIHDASGAHTLTNITVPTTTAITNRVTAYTDSLKDSTLDASKFKSTGLHQIALHSDSGTTKTLAPGQASKIRDTVAKMFSDSAATKSQLADEFLDHDTTGHHTANSVSLALQTIKGYGAPPSASTIAEAVLDVDTTGNHAANSFGLVLQTLKSFGVPPTAASIAALILSNPSYKLLTDVSGHVTSTNAGSALDSAATAHAAEAGAAKALHDTTIALATLLTSIGDSGTYSVGYKHMIAKHSDSGAVGGTSTIDTTAVYRMVARAIKDSSVTLDSLRSLLSAGIDPVVIARAILAYADTFTVSNTVGMLIKYAGTAANFASLEEQYHYHVDTIPDTSTAGYQIFHSDGSTGTMTLPDSLLWAINWMRRMNRVVRQESGNLLVNSYFSEDDTVPNGTNPTGWTVTTYGTSSSAYSVPIGHIGKNVFRVGADSATLDNGYVNLSPGWYRVGLLASGTIYRVSLDARIVDTAGVIASSKNLITFNDGLIVDSATWVNVGYSFKITTPRRYRLTLLPVLDRRGGTSQRIFLDAVSLRYIGQDTVYASNAGQFDTNTYKAVAAGNPSIFYGPAAPDTNAMKAAILHLAQEHPTDFGTSVEGNLIVIPMTGTGPYSVKIYAVDTSKNPDIAVQGINVVAKNGTGAPVRSGTTGPLGYIQFNFDDTGTYYIFGTGPLYQFGDDTLHVLPATDSTRVIGRTLASQPGMTWIFVEVSGPKSKRTGLQLAVSNLNKATDTTTGKILIPYLTSAYTDTSGFAAVQVPRSYIYSDSLKSLVNITLSSGTNVITPWNKFYVPNQDTVRLVVTR